MKIAKFNEELKQLDLAALQQKLDDVRRELFNIQLNVATAHLKDYSQFKKLKKNVARVLTCIQQKKQKEREHLSK